MGCEVNITTLIHLNESYNGIIIKICLPNQDKKKIRKISGNNKNKYIKTMQLILLKLIANAQLFFLLYLV